MVQLIGEINFTEIKHGARLINARLQGSFIGARVFSPYIMGGKIATEPEQNAPGASLLVSVLIGLSPYEPGNLGTLVVISANLNAWSLFPAAACGQCAQGE